MRHYTKLLLLPLLLTCFSCAVKIEKDNHTRELTNTPKYLISKKVDEEYLSIFAEVPKSRRIHEISLLLATERKFYKKRAVRDVFDVMCNAPAAQRATILYHTMPPLKLTMHLGKKHNDVREASADNRQIYFDFLSENGSYTPTEIYFSAREHLFAKSVYLGAHPKSGQTLLGQLIERELGAIRKDFPSDTTTGTLITADEMYECMINADSVIFENGSSYHLDELTDENFRKEIELIKAEERLYDSLLHSYKVDGGEFSPIPPRYAYIGIRPGATAKSQKKVIKQFESQNINSIIFSNSEFPWESRNAPPKREVTITENTVTFNNKFQFHYMNDTIYPGWIKTAITDSLGNKLSFPLYNVIPVFDSLGNMLTEIQDSGTCYIISDSAKGAPKEFREITMGTLELERLIPSFLYFSHEDKKSPVEFEFTDPVRAELMRKCLVYSFGVPFQLK